MSKALPEHQLKIEGLLKELEKLQGQLNDLSVWASRTRARLEHSPEEPPPEVRSTPTLKLLLFFHVYIMCLYCYHKNGSKPGAQVGFLNWGGPSCQQMISTQQVILE